MAVRDVCLMLCLLIGVASRPALACEVERRAAVPLEIASGLLVASVDVNGKPARFVIDTGAERTIISEAAVHRLGLRRDPWVGTTVRGVGGVERRANTVL